VVFGGLNKETNNLISNDLYVLCLNGVTNALLPKDKSVIQDEKKRLHGKPQAKPAKASARENSVSSQQNQQQVQQAKLPKAESQSSNQIDESAKDGQGVLQPFLE